MHKKVAKFLWRNIKTTKLANIIGFLLTYFLLYIYQIGTFVPKDTIYESPNYLGIGSMNSIFSDISLGPIKFLEFVSVKIFNDNTTFTRIISSLFIFVALVVFYRLVLKWRESNRIAVLSTLMLGTSAYVLHIGRFTFQEAMVLLTIPTIILIGTWLKSKKRVDLIILAIPIIAFLLYIPGVLLILLSLLIMFNKRIKVALKFAKNKNIYIGFGVGFVILAPLFYSIARFPAQIYRFLGIDTLINDGAIGVLNGLKNLPNELFWNGPNDPIKWLVGSPVLDVATILFAILGIVAYRRSQHTLRGLLILFFSVLSLILISTSSVLNLALFLPVFYLLVARGITYMLQNWFSVFPKNPAARTIGIVLVILPVFLSCYYNSWRYFSAWRYAPETKNVLNQKTS